VLGKQTQSEGEESDDERHSLLNQAQQSDLPFRGTLTRICPLLNLSFLLLSLSADVFIHSFIYLFIHSFIYVFIYLFIYLFTYWIYLLFTYWIYLLMNNN